MRRAALRDRLSEREREAAGAARQNAALQREVRRYRAAMDALPLGVVLLDDEGSEAYRNRRAAAPVGDVGSDALVAQALARLLEAGGPGHDVLELHGPPRRTVELRVEPLEPGGTVALVEDASERTHLDNVRRDFVANVNHELRTPIGALGVLAEAVQGETDPEVIERLTTRMISEVRRAQALIEDLLDLSRIEDGPERVCEWLEVQELFAAAADRVSALAEQCGVTVRVEPSAESLWGEPAELTSALGNLLDNAVKYSERGATVEAGGRLDGPWIELWVRDHGPGIPAKDLDRVFERFYRVDRARARGTGGSGLGLSIVRHVALNHGGEVSVRSVEGEGSTFTLRLPQRSVA